ncbi:hypothetical protein ZYGR_0N04590 [Zygosaccharomyces rouxii]|uniref:ATP-dependent helicase IRC3 n=1 Tax=Zygosaccharomyces rouxii TaxID=4956 RepID=A0A1Q3A030_ZYGRO|nr:hypothetical protein ZYGR_0N04590 [Zygosaccharomyces rouxii]
MFRLLRRCLTFSKPLRWYSQAVQLRDYQQHVIDKCLESLKDNKRRIGVSLATGGGKTVIFASLIKQLSQQTPHRALVLVHRRELVLQAAQTIKKFMPLARIQIEMGKYVCQDVKDCDVIVASVQSLIRRLDNYESTDIDLVIVDEAHHAVANSYLRILDHFKKDIPVVGFSATFERADHKALSTVMDEIVYHKGILEMINDNWLCEGKFTTVKIDADLNSVERASGSDDFKLDQLSRVMNIPEINGLVLKTYLHKSKEQPGGFNSTLLFAVDIKHVKALHHLFVSYGIKAECVTSETKARERDQIIDNFKKGDVKVLINCGIFTEGTDMPGIDCILLCRPTRSRSLLVQMIGRGLRLHHSKDFCHIIDFVGASDIGVVSVPTLAGIDNFQGDLDGATLQDLQEIKEQITATKKKHSEVQKLENESFNNWMKNKSCFDLTLTTFENFKSFYNQEHGDSTLPTAGTSSDDSLLNSSPYPFVKFAKNSWGLSLLSGHHLRIYKEGIKATKFNYTLKLYREIPIYLRDVTSTRYVPRELLSTDNLMQILGKVEQVISDLSTSKTGEGPVRNFTKFAKWRTDPATSKQKSAIHKKLTSRLTKRSDLMDSLNSEDIKRYTSGMKKGEAANILFATNIAPVYPLDSLLRVLRFKKNM